MNKSLISLLLLLIFNSKSAFSSAAQAEHHRLLLISMKREKQAAFRAETARIVYHEGLDLFKAGQYKEAKAFFLKNYSTICSHYHMHKIWNMFHQNYLYFKSQELYQASLDCLTRYYELYPKRAYLVATLELHKKLENFDALREAALLALSAREKEDGSGIYYDRDPSLPPRDMSDGLALSEVVYSYLASAKGSSDPAIVEKAIQDSRPYQELFIENIHKFGSSEWDKWDAGPYRSPFIFTEMIMDSVGEFPYAKEEAVRLLKESLQKDHPPATAREIKALYQSAHRLWALGDEIFDDEMAAMFKRVIDLNHFEPLADLDGIYLHGFQLGSYLFEHLEFDLGLKYLAKIPKDDERYEATYEMIFGHLGPRIAEIDERSFELFREDLNLDSKVWSKRADGLYESDPRSARACLNMAAFLDPEDDESVRRVAALTDEEGGMLESAYLRARESFLKERADPLWKNHIYRIREKLRQEAMSDGNEAMADRLRLDENFKFVFHDADVVSIARRQFDEAIWADGSDSAAVEKLFNILHGASLATYDDAVAAFEECHVFNDDIATFIVSHFETHGVGALGQVLERLCAREDADAVKGWGRAFQFLRPYPKAMSAAIRMAIRDLAVEDLEKALPKIQWVEDFLIQIVEADIPEAERQKFHSWFAKIILKYPERFLIEKRHGKIAIQSLRVKMQGWIDRGGSTQMQRNEARTDLNKIISSPCCRAHKSVLAHALYVKGRLMVLCEKHPAALSCFGKAMENSAGATKRGKRIYPKLHRQIEWKESHKSEFYSEDHHLVESDFANRLDYVEYLRKNRDHHSCSIM